MGDKKAARRSGSGLLEFGLQLACTGYRYTFVLQLACTGYRYKFGLQLACTGYRYKFGLQLACTVYRYKSGLQLACTGYRYKFDLMFTRLRPVPDLMERNNCEILGVSVHVTLHDNL